MKINFFIYFTSQWDEEMFGIALLLRSQSEIYRTEFRVMTCCAYSCTQYTLHTQHMLLTHTDDLLCLQLHTVVSAFFSHLHPPIRERLIPLTNANKTQQSTPFDTQAAMGLTIKLVFSRILPNHVSRYPQFQ